MTSPIDVEAYDKQQWPPDLRFNVIRVDVSSNTYATSEFLLNHTYEAFAVYMGGTLVKYVIWLTPSCRAFVTEQQFNKYFRRLDGAPAPTHN
jgi:hypothetical protein